MADINFSLDEYIARKSITNPSPGGRGARGGAAPRGGGTTRGGGAPRGSGRGGARPSVTARLGNRPSATPPPLKEPVQPLMKLGLDARDKILEKARQGDARDKIILKNRTKYRDAREKIGHPQQQQQQQPQEPQQSPMLNGRNGAVRGNASTPTTAPLYYPEPPQQRRSASNSVMESEPLMEEDLPRRRADARVFGRDNNIIIMTKNDYNDDGQPNDGYPKNLRHGNPVVMIKNDRARNAAPIDDEPPFPPPPRQRLPPPPTKTKVGSPRRGEPLVGRRPQQSVGASQRRQVQVKFHVSNDYLFITPGPSLHLLINLCS